MIDPVPSPFLVPTDGLFRVRDVRTRLHGRDPQAKKPKRQLAELREKLAGLQHRLAAEQRRALLVVFQAMDGGGKDSTIRWVFSGVNPAGVRVHAFSGPTSLERDQDFLWRVQTRLPRKGRIGVFNRSHYEEVLAVRVNPAFLEAQRLPRALPLMARMQERYDSIREWEQHLARNGTVIVKFWLNVSKEEQRKRLLARLDDPTKGWKFDPSDLAARAQWDAYMAAFEDALNATSRNWAPWYAIPADHKPAARVAVAEILVRVLEQIDPQYPRLDPEEVAGLHQYRAALEKK